MSFCREKLRRVSFVALQTAERRAIREFSHAVVEKQNMSSVLIQLSLSAIEVLMKLAYLSRKFTFEALSS